jgi:hypothetical protein
MKRHITLKMFGCLVLWPYPVSGKFQGQVSTTNNNVYLMEKRSSYDGIVGQAHINDHEGLLESYTF